MTDAPSPRPAGRKRLLPWLVAAVLLLGGAAAWYFLAGPGASSKPASAGDAGSPVMGAGPPGTGGPGPSAPPTQGGRRGGGAPGGPLPVTAAVARTGSINVVLTALGTAVARSTATVKPRVDGLLLATKFREGETVKPGTVLAEIDPKPFQVALAQAQGQLAKDQAQLQNARVDLERYRGLLAQDSIARQQVDTQEALVRQLEGTVQGDQAQVDSAKLQLSYTKVTAPIGGRLGLRQVDPGNMVKAGDANGIVVITQVQPITVTFSLPQDHLPAVLKRIASGERILVEAWDREGKKRLAMGALLTVDNQIDTSTGTVKLKAIYRNEEDELFPNQFVNVRLRLDTLQDVTLVPGAAIQRGSPGTFVYLVKDDNTVTLRPVKTGVVEGENIQLEQGLAPGDKVVVDGGDKLREGAKVEVIVRDSPATGGPRKGGPGKGRGGKGGDGKGGGMGRPPGDAKPADAKPGDAKPSDAKSGEAKPAQAKGARDAGRSEAR